MAIVNEVVTQFRFNGDLTPQESFNANLKSSITLLAGFAAGTQAMLAGLFAFTKGVTESTAPLIVLAGQIGSTTREVQQLRFVVDATGGDVDVLNASLRRLTKRAGDAANGGGPAIDAYKQLGIAVRDASGQVKPTTQLLHEARNAMSGLSDAEKISFGEKLGIDRKLIGLLRVSNDEFNKIIGQADAFGTLSEKDAAKLDGFNTALTESRYAMNGLRQMAAVGMAPIMKDLVSGFTELVISNKKWITDGLEKLARVGAAAGGFLKRMWPVLLGVAGAFGVLSLATGGFAAIMGALLSPVFLITAAIVGILLVVDDLISAFQGGESIIRDFFLNAFGIDIVPILQGMVDAAKAIFAEIMELAAPLIDFFSDLWGAVVSLFKGDFSGAFDYLVSAFKNLMAFIGGIFSKSIEGWLAIFNTLWSGIKSGFMAVIGGAIDWIKNALANLLPNWAKSLLAKVGIDFNAPEIDTPNSEQLASDAVRSEALQTSSTTNNSTSNSSVEQQNQINIYTDDAQAAGVAVQDNLSEMLRDADYMAGRGGI